MSKDYKISVTEDWVAPEETLLDSGSEYSDLERPISGDVFRLIFVSAIILFATVMAFTFRIGIIDHDSFAKLALQNRSVNFLIPPPRGIIIDRFGKPLVKNIQSFDVLVISREIMDNFSEENQNKVAGILDIPSEEFKQFISDGIKADSIFFAATDLDKDQVLELKYLNSDGYHIIPITKRHYVDGPQFSQVIG